MHGLPVIKWHPDLWKAWKIPAILLSIQIASCVNSEITWAGAPVHIFEHRAKPWSQRVYISNYPPSSLLYRRRRWWMPLNRSSSPELWTLRRALSLLVQHSWPLHSRSIENRPHPSFIEAIIDGVDLTPSAQLAQSTTYLLAQVSGHIDVIAYLFEMG